MPNIIRAIKINDDKAAKIIGRVLATTDLISAGFGISVVLYNFKLPVYLFYLYIIKELV